MGEWFDPINKEEEGTNLLTELLAFLKPHIFTVKTESRRNRGKISEIDNHPLLTRFKMMLQNDPDNEYLKIQIDEYERDHGLKK